MTVLCDGGSSWSAEYLMMSDQKNSFNFSFSSTLAFLMSSLTIEISIHYFAVWERLATWREREWWLWCVKLWLFHFTFPSSIPSRERTIMGKLSRISQARIQSPSNSYKPTSIQPVSIYFHVFMFFSRVQPYSLSTIIFMSYLMKVRLIKK